MLIERREFADLCYNRPDDLISAQIFSDGSPITGHELQGMVLFLWLVDGLRRLVLPGIHLHYGGSRLVDKAVALLWALFLVLGLDLKIWDWFRNKVTAITTDMGTEFGIAVLPDFAAAFIHRVRGMFMSDAAKAIDFNSRLFPFTLRIAGWGHKFGDLMKEACKCISIWPSPLQGIRVMVRFFRDRGWRKQIVRVLHGVFPEAKALLERFRATFIKWRYETIAVALSELSRLKYLCETYLKDVEYVFGDGFQDKQLLQDVKSTCKWKELWAFVSAFHKKVTWPLDRSRRWGLMCTCHAHEREVDQIKHFKCDRNSRRLPEARQFLQDAYDDLTDTAQRLTLDECESYGWLYIRRHHLLCEKCLRFLG